MDHETPNEKAHGNLNFSAPLLSTRRLAGAFPDAGNSDSNSGGIVCDTCKRVPFSWEQAPGMPKDIERSGLQVEDRPPPPPKLPPGRYRPPPMEASKNEDNDYYEDMDSNDEDNGDASDDVFSCATDIFSLSDSLDVTDSLSGLNSEITESTGDQSPGFIIRRFLPAANALASSSSALFASKKIINRRVPPSCHWAKELNDGQHPAGCAPRSVAQSYSPPKACGLTLISPWLMKNTLCRSKSPVRRGSTNMKLNGNTRRTRSSSTEGPSRRGGGGT